MTGFFVRTSDGRTVEIENLSEEELNIFLKNLNRAQAKKWLVGLINWIKTNVKEL